MADKTPSDPDTDETPHYHGHRDRLRRRFREAAPAALSDYELMELVLFRVIPRRDVKELAKNWSARFGSFAEAVSAAGAPRRGQGRRRIDRHRIEARRSRGKPGRQGRGQAPRGTVVMAGGDRLLPHDDGLRRQGAIPHPVPRQAQQLIADEVQQTGTIDHTPVYPREVVKRALELSATAIVLVHNHPSGDPTPSQADIQMTKHIAEIAAASRRHGA